MNYFCISSICLIDSLTATSHCIFGPRVIAVWQMQFFSIWNLSRLRSIVDPVLRQPKKVAKLDRCDCRWAHAIFFYLEPVLFEINCWSSIEKSKKNAAKLDRWTPLWAVVVRRRILLFLTSPVPAPLIYRKRTN